MLLGATAALFVMALHASVVVEDEDEEEEDPLPMCVLPAEVNLVCHVEVDVTGDGEHEIAYCISRYGQEYVMVLGGKA